MACRHSSPSKQAQYVALLRQTPKPIFICAAPTHGWTTRRRRRSHPCRGRRVRYHAADKTNAGTNELPSSHGPRVFWPANRAAHLHKLVLPERDGRHAGERERKAMCAAEGNRWSGEGHRLGTLQLYEKIGGEKSTMLCPWINSGITTNRPICNRKGICATGALLCGT